jgi:hypothetical protein
MSEKFFIKESAAIKKQMKKKTIIGIFTAAFSELIVKVSVRNSLLKTNNNANDKRIIPGTIHFPFM